MASPPIQLQVGMPAPGFGSVAPSQNANLGQNPKEAEEIERLRSTHDLYKIYAPEWELYLDAYEGGSAMSVEKHLFKHQRENEEDFLDRLKRAHYMNYCDVLVDFFTNFIFGETIQRDGGTNSAWYDAFVLNVNRKGDDVDSYMRLVSDDFQIYGMNWNEVTAPPKPNGLDVVTKQDELDYNLDPYWVLIHPDEMLDWVADEFDRLIYAKRKQISERLNGRKKQIVEKYTEWYVDVVVISEVDVTDPQNPEYLGKNETTNPVDQIPLVLSRFKRSKRYSFMGNSMIRDFAYNNRAIMNLTSLIDEFDYRQAFNILAKETESVVPLASQEEGVMSQSNVMEIPKGAQMPQYLSPPADPAKFLQAERAYIKQEMFKRAAQDTLNELFNGEQKSGFSQAQSFSKTVPFIATRADLLEDTETKLMQLTMKYKGLKWDGSIKYKDRYELTNLQDRISQLLQLGRDLRLESETFIKEELKRFVEEYDGKLKQDPAMIKKIRDEIDAMDWKEWLDTQKQALIGQPKSPGDQQKPKQSGTMQEVTAKSKKQGDSASNKLQ